MSMKMHITKCHKMSQKVLHNLKGLRIKNQNIIIIGNLNINSNCNKFDLKTIIPGNIDILVVIETKLHLSRHL